MTMFTCEKCGKVFTEKRSLTRHQKTNADSSQTYSCGVCSKEFSPADTRNRHEAAHSYSLTWGVCDQYFNILDILARHRSQHEIPEAKQRLPMKTPPTNTHQEKSRVAADADVLPDDPETRALHRQH
jgi:methionyl-tRNA synthetase